MSDATSTIPKFPHVRVRLVGEDGNAYAILGRVNRALAAAGVAATERKQFMDEATSGNYANLLATCVRWVDCSFDDDDFDGAA
jgi:hypothetical protein